SDTVKVTPEFKGPKWYVSTSGVSTNDGSSTAPLSHLSGAIDKAASGDTVVVLKGTHSGSNNRGIDFDASKPLVIMGDPSYAADSTIIDAGGRDRHFTFNSGEDTTFQIIGLTLYNGAQTSGNGGGSVLIHGQSSTVFKKVIFKENTSTSDDWRTAGAVSIYNSSGLFYDCVFDANENDITGNTNDQQARGGAVKINTSNSYGVNISKFIRCTFKNNIAKANGVALGGALSIYEGGADVINCLFYGNQTISAVGGQSGNRDSRGGAINIRSTAYWNNQGDRIVNNSQIINNTIYGNSATSEMSNSNTRAGGLDLSEMSDEVKVTFFNNILWGNTAGDGTNISENDVYISQGSASKSSMDYNLIGNLTDVGNYQLFGDHSVSVDPAFTNALSHDFSLSDQSQAIGAGIATYEEVNTPSTDLAGNARPNPAGSNPDIGAYENPLAISPYPAPVKNLAGSSGGGTANLSWDPNTETGITYYMVAKNTTKGFTPTDADTVGRTTGTSYTVSGLENGTPYYFRVRAVNSAGQQGSYSSYVEVVPAFNGPVWYVAVDGNNSNEGSESAPLSNLQTAFEKAYDGNTIVLKAGTYSGSNNRGINLSSDKNLTIKGEGSEVTILDGEHSDRLFNISGGVHKISDMTIQRGWSSWQSGGIDVWSDASVEISKVVFRENHSRSGGAVSVGGLTKAKFIDCVFIDNLAEYRDDNDGTGGGQGGAVKVEIHSADSDHLVEFIRCSFIRNRAFVNGNNTSNNNYYSASGGAVAVWWGRTNFVNCLFANNEARIDNGQCGTDDNGNDWCPNVSGGAIAADASIWNVDEERSEGVTSTIINSTFVNNRAYGSGEEGVHVYAGAMLFWGRYDDQSGGANSSHILFNNIIYGNSADGPNQPGEYEQNITLHTDRRVMHSDHNLIQFLDHYKGPQNWAGPNDFEADPGFADPMNGDFSLHRFSESIEMGTLEFEGFTAPSDDITGKMRPVPPETPP
ncbi:MAG TPA: hypothetical protein EYN68_07995, partial [Candidatus Marinimicrobia bacterium]|nr:hypothetical protein [Candidatus Neomarinimicrobiota bacterium]